MMKRVVLAFALVCASSAAAQHFKYRAEIGQSGEVQLVPDATEAPDARDAITASPGTNTDKLEAFSSALRGKQVYVQTSPTGEVEAVYAFQNDQIPAGMLEGLEPGGQIVAAMSDSWDWGMSPEEMQAIASAAARELLNAARETGCSFDPLPETITPTVEVSFTLLAGGSFSVSATWNTRDICTP